MNKKYIQSNERESGFTLIELSLAMTFLAFIVLFVVTMIMQMINVYNKSIALSQMNQTGRQIMSDLNNGARFSSSIVNNSGRMCVGGTTYIWNIGTATTNKFTDAGAPALRLVRVRDVTGLYCSSPSKMPTLNDANTTVIVGQNILVQAFDITSSSDSKLLRANVVLSTGGANAPEGSVAAGLTCRNNDFCAFATYNFVIYQRGMK